MTSIRRRLTVGLLAGFLILLGSGGAAIYFMTRAHLVAQWDSALLSHAQAISAPIRQEEGLEFDIPPALLEEFSAPGSGEYFEISDGEQRVLRSSRRDTANSAGQGPSLTNTPRFWTATLDGRPARAVGFRFTPQPDDEHKPNRNPPALTIVVVREQGPLDRTLRQLLAVLAAVGTGALVGTVAVVSIATRSGLRPLGIIAEQANRIHARTLDYRFPVGAVPAELRPICARLNDLLSRLEQSFQREHRFSADVAHELRTPIAELRSLSEVALKWHTGDHETAAAFQDAADIARKMESIVTGLLMLMRCEEGRQAVRCESVGIEPLVRSVWAPFAAAAERKTLHLGFDLPAGIAVRTDPAALEIVLANLFSNAVAYTPPGGDVAIAALPQGCDLTISCTNTVRDLAPADLPHLTERFWRKDPARHDSTHSGLGLSIAESLLRLLQTEFRMEMPEPDRFRISFNLPAPNRAPALDTHGTIMTQK